MFSENASNSNAIESAIGPVVEAMENRRLLSVTLVDGVLMVGGTDNSDAIELALNCDGSKVKVTVNGEVHKFDLDEVEQIRASGKGGHDKIKVRRRGDDLDVKVKMSGGAGDDTLAGGEMDDVLKGRDGDDILKGGEGEDELYGGDGDDELDGESDGDELYGGEDRDHDKDEDDSLEDGDKYDFSDGKSDGESDGMSDGMSEGMSDGKSDGDHDDVLEPKSDGASDGMSDGDADDVLDDDENEDLLDREEM